jgi:ubiquitin C-terminal hydrolase
MMKECGLSNLGNTCYLNSLIQTFSNIPLFRDYIMNENNLMQDFHFTDDLNANIKMVNDSVLFQLYKIIYIQHTKNANIVPIKFKKCLEKKSNLFNGSEQDVQEIFSLLIEIMHSETNYDLQNQINVSNQELLKSININWSKYSKIYEMFYGMNSETHYCTSCDYKDIKYIPSLSLILRIPKLNHSNLNLQKCITIKSNIRNIKISKNQKKIMLATLSQKFKDNIIENNKCPSFTLYDCFNEYNKINNIDFSCPLCSRNNIVSKSKIVLTPNILVIFISRFETFNSMLIKKKNLIEFPFTIDINSITDTSEQKTEYKLISVINHLGNDIETGHYTTFALCDKDNKWYSYNDNLVKQISSYNIITNNAYLLFYSKL